jgi:hypothetical protein
MGLEEQVKSCNKEGINFRSRANKRKKESAKSKLAQGTQEPVFLTKQCLREKRKCCQKKANLGAGVVAQW